MALTTPRLPHARPLALWLSLCAALVACMVLVGGYTRLSGSGLSITEWKPIHGVIPPVNEMEWQEEFAAYRASPQYEKINKGMHLEEFKAIYWPEYWHRVLGRAIGVVFLIPFLFFLVRKQISKPLATRLAIIFALGGLQGFAGWYMVQSGLVLNPHVSHLRLALHLGLAFLIFAYLIWTIMDMRPAGKSAVPIAAARPGFMLYLTLLSAQILLGALTAGLHAGLIYNTYPTMNGAWIPADLFATHPWYENITLIQFAHRWNAALVVIAFAWWSFKYLPHAEPSLKYLSVAIALVLFLQFLLGILTLINAVPLGLALKHQMTGLALFGLSIAALHGLCNTRKL